MRGKPSEMGGIIKGLLGLENTEADKNALDKNSARKFIKDLDILYFTGDHSNAPDFAKLIKDIGKEDSNIGNISKDLYCIKAEAALIQASNTIKGFLSAAQIMWDSASDKEREKYNNSFELYKLAKISGVKVTEDGVILTENGLLYKLEILNEENGVSGEFKELDSDYIQKDIKRGDTVRYQIEVTHTTDWTDAALREFLGSSSFMRRSGRAWRISIPEMSVPFRMQ